MYRVMLTILLLAGCGGAGMREVIVQAPAEPGAPARLSTDVGSFEVREKNVELLRQVLAGEPSDVTIYAGGHDR